MKRDKKPKSTGFNRPAATALDGVRNVRKWCPIEKRRQQGAGECQHQKISLEVGLYY